MSAQVEERAPRLLDPGEAGWAPEPNVTDEERLLYGDLAGAVRIAGRAAVATEQAYSLVCKHTQNPATRQEEEEFALLVREAWQAHRAAARAYRGLALSVAHTRTTYAERNDDGYEPLRPRDWNPEPGA